MAAVFHPLHALEAHEFADDLIAQHFGEQRVGFQRIAGFLERLRQGLDATCRNLFKAQLVEVLVADMIDFQLAVDTVQACGNDRGADRYGLQPASGRRNSRRP